MKASPSRNILKRSAVVLLKIVLFLILFVVLVYALIQTPPVQNFARKKMVAFLESRLQTKVEVGRLSITFPKRITLEDVYIEDRQQDTLLSGGKLKVDISFWKLLRNEVEIKNIELLNIYAKIKRSLPDTVYNFQFIVDAFVRDKSKDTSLVADTTAMKMEIDHLLLDSVRIIYNDVITGNDMDISLIHFDTKIDKFDPYNLHFDFPTTSLKGVTAKIYQSKPLVKSEPLSKDLAESQQPIPFQLNFKELLLDSVNVDYRNDVSAFYTQLNIGNLVVHSNNVDLQNRIIDLKDLQLDSTNVNIKLGKKAEARVIEKELKQELQSTTQNNWRVMVGSLQLNKNNLKFDNDNSPRQSYGMDYAHLKADSLTLHATNFLLSKDSTAAEITKGSFREQSGFVLNQLQTRFLYAFNQAYLYDLYLKTPGTELKRSAAIRYPSMKALAKNIGLMQLEADFVDSRIKIKDLLTFAPQLRVQPLFSNPNDTWWLDGRISGKISDLTMQRFKLRGLQSTRMDISGNIKGLPDMKKLQGSLVIHAATSSKRDIALFIPKGSLPTNITLPDNVNLNGSVNGNLNDVNGKLVVTTSLGSASFNGTVGNLSTPKNIKYNALVTAQNLQIGTIIQNRDVIGSVTANFRAKGQGTDPKTASLEINGVVESAEINKYNYQDFIVDGSLANQLFDVKASIRDPNIDLTIDASGNTFSKFPAVKFTANVDSLKTLPLHLTTEPVFFHGNVTGDFASTDPDNLEGELLATNSLIVTKEQRIQLDTIQMLAGRNDSGHYISVNSEILSAHLQGTYRLTQLGTIFQQSIQPYFTLVPNTSVIATEPFDFTFDAYVSEQPVLKTLIPELKEMDSVRIQSRFSSTNGWNAAISAPYIQYGPNFLYDLNFNASTTSSDTSQSALLVNASLSHFKSGATTDIYQPSFSASIADNNIDFAFNVEDKNEKDKYHFEGLFSQPSFGNYTLNLKPDSLLLNYDQWSVNTGNQINFTQKNITANNFVLSKGNEKLSINSTSNAENAPLDIDFTEFQIATITGFFKADSVFADGRLNGKATLLEYKTQPVFTADLSIDDFNMNRDTVGNIKLQVNNQTENTYTVNANITGRGNDVVLEGIYHPKPVNDNSFDLTMDIRQLHLNTVQGATMGNIRGATGTANGKLHVSGTFADPDLVGDINFDKAGFNITMLNSYFTLDQQKLEFRENGIYFNEFTIRDTMNNTAIIDGTAYTGDFKNYLFDLYVTTDNFRALNTTKKDNKLYYGQLYFTSDLNVKGTNIQPIVDGSIVVNDKTNMTVVIPQAQPGVVDREGIVQFVDMDAVGTDSLFLTAVDSLKISSIHGLDITANITIVKEAIFNVVVDEANGDFINVQGEALLSTGIDPSGKITLTGSYELEQGSYEISFNFLRRQFDIQKGSRIVWTGDPTSAQLNVTAVYIANTSPIDLVADQVASSDAAIRNTYLQKLPFEVHLTLTGELMKPVVAFDILLPEKSYGISNDVVSTVQTRLTELRQD